MSAPFPAAESLQRDDTAVHDMRWVMDFILGVRQIRGEMDIAPLKKIDVLLQNAGADDETRLAAHGAYLTRLAGVNPPRILPPGEAAPIAAIALVGTLEILVPMAGLIDPVAELDRLSKRRLKNEAELKKFDAKLGNAEFVANAPVEVVVKDQARAAELRTEIAQIQAQYARVEALRAQ